MILLFSEARVGMWFLEEPHSQEGERGPDPCLVLHGEAFSDAPHGVNSFPCSPHTCSYQSTPEVSGAVQSVCL